jgi:hypothetical protein
VPGLDRGSGLLRPPCARAAVRARAREGAGEAGGAAGAGAGEAGGEAGGPAGRTCWPEAATWRSSCSQYTVAAARSVPGRGGGGLEAALWARRSTALL